MTSWGTFGCVAILCHLCKIGPVNEVLTYLKEA